MGNGKHLPLGNAAECIEMILMLGGCICAVSPNWPSGREFNTLPKEELTQKQCMESRESY